MWFVPALVVLWLSGARDGATATVALLAGVLGFAALALAHPAAPVLARRRLWHPARHIEARDPQCCLNPQAKSAPMTNPFKGRTGIDRVLRAVGYSIDGLKTAYRGESAFRQEFWVAVVLLPGAFWLGRNWIEVGCCADRYCWC